MNLDRESEKTFTIKQFGPDSTSDRDDLVAVEEPVEIRLSYLRDGKKVMQQVAITMRTPGNDTELAVGFLHGEGIITSRDQINDIVISGTDDSGQATNNIVRVDLDDSVEIDPKRLQRNFISNSSCGVCGKASLESLKVKTNHDLSLMQVGVPAASIYEMPNSLRKIQPAFDLTGGIHAAGFADSSGNVELVREDVGRHNAVDKLIGTLFQQGDLPVADRTIVVSGRASFEIVQKAIVAGVPIMVAVGAPSSLAVELANEYKMTLIGFASQKRFNVYTHAERIVD